jgi:hypothetical protein
VSRPFRVISAQETKARRRKQFNNGLKNATRNSLVRLSFRDASENALEQFQQKWEPVLRPELQRKQ